MTENATVPWGVTNYLLRSPRLLMVEGKVEVNWLLAILSSIRLVILENKSPGIDPSNLLSFIRRNSVQQAWMSGPRQKHRGVEGE